MRALPRTHRPALAESAEDPGSEKPVPNAGAEERELLLALSRGSRLAFLRLLEAHAACIRGYLAHRLTRPSDVDDVAQEVFMAALENAASYRGTSGLRAWLLGIARIRALDALRTRARRQAQEGDTLDERLHARALARLEDDAVHVERAERLDALSTCVAQLDAGPRRLVERFYYRGESAEALSAEIGRSASAVRMTLLRLRGVLRRCVEGHLAERNGAS